MNQIKLKSLWKLLYFVAYTWIRILISIVTSFENEFHMAIYHSKKIDYEIIYSRL